MDGEGINAARVNRRARQQQQIIIDVAMQSTLQTMTKRRGYFLFRSSVSRRFVRCSSWLVTRALSVPLRGKEVHPPEDDCTDTGLVSASRQR